MELRHLRHFVSAAEQGSVGKAAVHEKLTQPAITRSIRSLERMLGIQLFIRKRSGIVLTVYGERLLEHARLILNTRERALADLGSMREGQLGSIVIGVGAYFPSKLVPLAINTLLARPHVSVSVIEEPFDVLCGKLKTANIDVIYSVLPPDNNDSDLVFEKLFPIQSHVWARKRHPLVRTRRVSAVELLSAAWVMPDGEHISRIAQHFFATLGGDPPAAKVQTNSVSLAISSMLNHDLLAVLPDLSVQLAGGAQHLARVKIDPQPVRTHAGIVYLRQGVHTQVFHDFVTAIRKLVTKFMRDQALSGQPPVAP